MKVIGRMLFDISDILRLRGYYDESYQYHEIPRQTDEEDDCSGTKSKRGNLIMNWYSTLIKWEGYAEKLYPLRDEISYIFETKCFYDDKWEYHEKFYEADDDTVFLLKRS